MFIAKLLQLVIFLTLSIPSSAQGGTYNWTNNDNLTFMPENYVRDFTYPRAIFDLETSYNATLFKSLCSTPQTLATECAGWTEEDLNHLKVAQDKVTNFQGALNEFYDFAFQMVAVTYVWGVGMYLWCRRHFSFRFWPDPQSFETTSGIKSFLNFQTPFTAEEIKTIVVTDSEEDEHIFAGIDLSDYISESSDSERKDREENPNEYGRLFSRKVRHTDELKKPKYKNQRKIYRKKKQLPNVNNPMHGTTVRNFDPPKHSGKKFDEYGTPKYPRIYQIRRLVNQPNRFLARL